MRIICSILFFFAFDASASCVGEFKSAAQKIPHRLIQMGYSNFGSLDLRKFVREMNQVQVVGATIKEIAPLNGNDIRSTARWDVKKNFLGQVIRMIKVDCRWWKKYPLAMNALAFHEYTAPLGFVADHSNYLLAKLSWMLTLKEVKAVLTAREFRLLEDGITTLANESTQVVAMRKGGVVGVGGGGESSSLDAQMRRILEALEQLKIARRSGNKKAIENALENLDFSIVDQTHVIVGERLVWE